MVSIEWAGSDALVYTQPDTLGRPSKVLHSWVIYIVYIYNTYIHICTSIRIYIPLCNVHIYLCMFALQSLPAIMMYLQCNLGQDCTTPSVLNKSLCCIKAFHCRLTVHCWHCRSCTTPWGSHKQQTDASCRKTSLSAFWNWLQPMMVHTSPSTQTQRLPLRWASCHPQSTHSRDVTISLMSLCQCVSPRVALTRRLQPFSGWPAVFTICCTQLFFLTCRTCTAGHVQQER